MKDIYTDATLISTNIREAQRLLNVDNLEELSFYSFPWLFGTSAGPNTEAIAKQVCTVFQVTVYIDYKNDKCAKYCNGVWKVLESCNHDFEGW